MCVFCRFCLSVNEYINIIRFSNTPPPSHSLLNFICHQKNNIPKYGLGNKMAPASNYEAGFESLVFTFLPDKTIYTRAILLTKYRLTCLNLRTLPFVLAVFYLFICYFSFRFSKPELTLPPAPRGRVAECGS